MAGGAPSFITPARAVDRRGRARRSGSWSFIAGAGLGGGEATEPKLKAKAKGRVWSGFGPLRLWLSLLVIECVASTAGVV
jgi:hypothetical protein